MKSRISVIISILLLVILLSSDIIFCCSAGYNYEPGNGQCLSCPIGHFCEKDQQPKKCPPGTVSRSNNAGYPRTHCLTCNDGYYNDKEGQGTCKVCPEGHYCPNPKDKKLPCPTGTYSRSNEPNYRRVHCLTCKDGYYNDKEGQGTCKTCPEGHYCPRPFLKLPCPVGTYSRSNEPNYPRVHCLTCNDGYYNDNEAGTQCKVCPEGHFCPRPFLKLPCPTGTYSRSNEPNYPRTHCLSSSTNTNSCSLGFYKYDSYCRRCDDGHFCLSSESSPQPCPVGTTNYRENTHRTTCKICPLSTYNQKSGSISDGSFFECYTCPLGHFCPVHNSAPKICPPGTTNHNLKSFRYRCKECPVGTFNTNYGGINDGNYYDCNVCPLGHYCPSREKDPIECPAGTTNQYHTSLRETCIPCDIGYYNVEKAGIYDGSYSDCKRCPPGYYCPSTDRCPIKCPENTKSSSGGFRIEDCLPCKNCFVFPVMCTDTPLICTSPKPTTEEWSLAQLAENGDCKFYEQLEVEMNCGPTGYFTAYGGKYCRKFGENFDSFNEEGKTWVNSVRKCLMAHLLLSLNGKSPDEYLTCPQFADFAFDTHVSCYLNPGFDSKSICDIWASKNAVGLLKTYEVMDFFKSTSALIQIFTTGRQCIAQYGASILSFVSEVQNSLNATLSNLIAE